MTKFKTPPIEEELCKTVESILKSFGLGYSFRSIIRTDNKKVRIHKFGALIFRDRELYPFSLDEKGREEFILAVNSRISKISSDYIAEIDLDGVSILIKHV